jgi:peptide/nickel transport system substrate-binding protein
VFKKGLIGVGDYFIKNIDLNGNFVQSITLGLNKNSLSTVKFVFYPTEKSLKTAFALGEVTQASGLSSYDFQKTSFDKFNSTTVKKSIDSTHLVTLFYNVTDANLSDKKLRLALNYALPENFGQGVKAYLPYYPDSIYFNTDIPVRHQDFEHAKLLLPNSKTQLTITTLKKFSPVAREIAKAWGKIGIKTKISEVESVPDKFQIFLSDFNLPADPDQYVLWHSAQPSNITKYKNLRIDKLLEDGRKTIDVGERQKIYADFQRFLLDDMPASFLYFPYSYDITRN